MAEPEKIRSSKPSLRLDESQSQQLANIKEKLGKNNISISYSVINDVLMSGSNPKSRETQHGKHNSSVANLTNIFTLKQIASSGIKSDNIEDALRLILSLYEEEALGLVIQALHNHTTTTSKSSTPIADSTNGSREEIFMPTATAAAPSSAVSEAVSSAVVPTAVSPSEVSTAASSAEVPPVAPVKVSASVVPATASSAVVSTAVSPSVVPPAVIPVKVSASVVPVAPAIPEEITKLCSRLAGIGNKPQELLNEISKLKGLELVGNLSSDSLKIIYSAIFDIFKRNPNTKIHMLSHQSGYKTHLEINRFLMPHPDYVGRRLHKHGKNIFRDAGIIKLLEENPQIKAIVAPMATKIAKNGTNSHFVSKIIEGDDVGKPINLDSVGYTWNPANGGSDVLDSIETLLAIIFDLPIHKYNKEEQQIKTIEYSINPDTFTWKNSTDLTKIPFFFHTYATLKPEQQALYQQFISFNHIDCLNTYSTQLNQIVSSKPLQITKDESKITQSVLLPIYKQFIQLYEVQNQQNKEYGFYNFLILLLKLQMQNDNVSETDASHYLSVLAEQIEHFKDLTETDFQIICAFLDCKSKAIEDSNFFEVMFYFASILPIFKKEHEEFYEKLEKTTKSSGLETESFVGLIMDYDNANILRSINTNLERVWQTNTRPVPQSILSNGDSYEYILNKFGTLKNTLFQQQVKRNIGQRQIRCSNRDGKESSPVRFVAPTSKYHFNKMFNLLWKIFTENNIEFDNQEVLPTIVRVAMIAVELDQKIPRDIYDSVFKIGEIFAMLICEYKQEDTTKKRQLEIINILSTYNTEKLLGLKKELSEYMQTKFPSITDPVIIDVETDKTMPSISSILTTLTYYPNYLNTLREISVYLIAQEQDGKGFFAKLGNYSVNKIMRNSEFQKKLIKEFFEVCLESDRSGVTDPVKVLPLTSTGKAEQILKYLTSVPDANTGAVIQYSLPKCTKNLLDNIIDECASRPEIPNISKTTIDGVKDKFISPSTQTSFDETTLQAIRNKINQSGLKQLLEIEKGQTKQNSR